MDWHQHLSVYQQVGLLGSQNESFLHLPTTAVRFQASHWPGCLLTWQHMFLWKNEVNSMLIISGAVKTKSLFCFLCAKPEQIYSKHYGCISMKARGEASTNQTVCTVYLESVHHHPPTHTYTHTHTCSIAVLPFLIPFISLCSLFSVSKSRVQGVIC